MRPIGSAKNLEKRRRRAVELSRIGLGLSEIAKRVRSSVSSVHRWLLAWNNGGGKALDPKPVPGRPKKLSASQHKKLEALLLSGARACGFPNEMWTLKRIASVVHREFGVQYHPSHVWKVLRSCGWSCQMPERRAIRRDEEAIEHWKRHKWPAIKKARRLGAHIVFIDESGFLLIPTRRRTWGIQGQTPSVPYNYRHDRIS